MDIINSSILRYCSSPSVLTSGIRALTVLWKISCSSKYFMATDKLGENFVQPAIPRFDGHYDHWSMLMENFLRSKEYWDLVKEGYVEPEEGLVLTQPQQKKTWWSEAERFEGEELSVPGHWSCHSGDNSPKRHFKTDLGFHEEEISRLHKGETTATPSSSQRAWDSSNEGGRVCGWVFC